VHVDNCVTNPLVTKFLKFDVIHRGRVGVIRKHNRDDEPEDSMLLSFTLK
jgi:hypothetical protein